MKKPFHSPGALLFYATPFLILALGALYLGWRWDEMPERFPSHWNLAGKVDGWATRTPLNVAMPLIIALVLDLIILIVAAEFTRRMKRLYQSGSGSAVRPEDQAQRGVGTLAVVVCLFISLVCTAIAAAMPFAAHSSTFGGLLVLGAVMGSFVLMVFVLLMVGKSTDWQTEARKVALANGTLDPALDAARRDPRYWKWGVFYYNPADPAVWVDKLYGGGWTTNMARWQSWVWVAGTLGPVFFLLGLLLLRGCC